MAELNTSIKVILDDVLEHPLLRDVTLEYVIKSAISLMRLIGAPKMFTTKLEPLSIEGYRAALPLDFHSMNQVRDSTSHVAYTYGTDSFSMSTNNKDCGLTYTIQGGIIYTSAVKCEIEISYEAIILDCDGNPLIPDNADFIRALEDYIKMKKFSILYDLGSINAQVLNDAKSEYAWSVATCESEFKRLSLDEMEALSNSLNTLVVRTNSHANGFRNLGTREHIIKH